MKKINPKFNLLINSIIPLVNIGETYCIGLSGGSDSVLLLHYLQKASLNKRFRVVALHLNHSLRNDESEGDAIFCKDICEALNIEFITKKVDIKQIATEKKLSIEDAARKYRYKWFAEICHKINANSIFIAHHADDQAETVLMRLFRGAGLKGLAGMKKITCFDKLKILRPWLDIPRNILDNEIEKIKLKYRYDSSNSNINFDRNWVRQRLIPELNSHFKSDVRERLVRTAIMSSEANDFILQHAEKTFCKHKRKSLLGFVFPLDKFKQLHPAEQSAVLILMFSSMDLITRISYKGIIELRNFALSNSLHCSHQFQEFITTGKAYDHLYVGLKHNLKINTAKIKVGDSFTTKSGLNISIKQIENRGISTSSNGEAWEKIALGFETRMIQYASIPKNSVFNIRSRKAGDRYTPIHGKESKIKKMFIDAHIPQQIKNAIPIIELNNQIVWVSGWRIAQGFQIPDNAIKKGMQNIEIRINSF